MRAAASLPPIYVDISLSFPVIADDGDADIPSTNTAVASTRLVHYG